MARGLSFAFGGDENTSYDDLKHKRLFGELMMQRGRRSRAPKTAIEGLANASQSITGALMARKFGDQANAQRDEFSTLFNGALNGFQAPGGGVSGGGNSFAPPPNPNDEAYPVGTPVTGNEQAPPEYDMGQANITAGNKEQFIAEMMPHAMRVSQSTGLDPRLVIAQAAQETGWGAHAPGNNYFGIKSHGKSGGNNLVTNEVIGGQNVTVNDSFRAYNGMGDSADGYASFLQENPRYGAMLSANGLDGQLAELGRSGYATDPNYAQSVGNIARSIPMSGQQGQQGVNPMLLSMLSDPRATQAQRSVLGMLMQQQLKANDPMRQLQMQNLQGQIDSRGQMTPYQQAQLQMQQSELDAGGSAPSGFTTLDMQAQAAGLDPGTPDYQNFMLNGGGAPATFRALDMQANAAGFDDGTPQYNEFMATRGAGLAAGAKTTATNVANVATGGAAAEAVAQGSAQGKANVGLNSELVEMQRNMPGLLTVVDKLSELADTATYTYAGQARDFAQKQLGGDPSEGALARAEYIAVVDNQVLPLLRQTFGAAFTAKEGETLKNTLGDPDKSPAEKKAVLKAFVAQKKRDLIARGGSVPAAQYDFPGMSAADLSSVDIGGLTDDQMTAMENRFKELGM